MAQAVSRLPVTSVHVRSVMDKVILSISFHHAYPHSQGTSPGGRTVGQLVTAAQTYRVTLST
jgi:hypothetical protein